MSGKDAFGKFLKSIIKGDESYSADEECWSYEKYINEFISTQSGSDVYNNIKTISKKWNKSFKAIWRAWKFMYGVHELEELNNK